MLILDETKESWLCRHLNWTLAIVWLSNIAATVVTIIYAYAYADITPVISLILYSLFLLGIDVWVLMRKGRNPAHILWTFLLGIHIAQIIYLCMANKREPKWN